MYVFRPQFFFRLPHGIFETQTLTNTYVHRVGGALNHDADFNDRLRRILQYLERTNTHTKKPVSKDLLFCSASRRRRCPRDQCIYTRIQTEYVAIWQPDSLLYIYYIIITIRWKRRRRRPFPFFSWPYEKGDGGNISIIILLICLYSPSIYTTHAADVALCNNYVFYMQTHLSRENCQQSPSNPSALTTTTTMTVYPWIFVLRLRSLFARHTRIKTIW